MVIATIIFLDCHNLIQNINGHYAVEAMKCVI